MKENENALFDALGDPTRRAIVARIAHGPVSASELAAPIGVTLTAIGQHIRILERAGLIATHKHGRRRLCDLRPDGFSAVERWTRSCREAWEARLDRLGDLLDGLSED
jgi:DNA-binding transcriptional ArsR family regulator